MPAPTYPIQTLTKTTTAPASWDIALGNIPSLQSVVKFGGAGPAGAGDAPLDVWSPGGDYEGQPIVGAPVLTATVVSAGLLDTALGTGARTVQVFGLDENLEPVDEIVTLDGTTPVPLTNLYERLNRMKVLTAGSGGENDAVISAVRDVTNEVFATIPSGLNQTQIAAYTIPAGKVGVLTNLWVSIGLANGNSGSAEVTLRARPQGGVYQAARSFTLSNSAAVNPITLPVTFDEGTDLKVRVEDISDNNTFITAEFDLVLVDKI